MALAGTGGTLGALMKANIDSLTDEQKQDRDKLFEEMGKAVIAHLIGSAGVGAVKITSQPVAVTSVSGVLTGGGVSGPGTGTCSGVGDLQ